MKQYLAVILSVLIIYQATTDWTQPARIGDVDFHPDFTEEEIQAGIDRAHQQGLSVVMCWLTSKVTSTMMKWPLFSGQVRRASNTQVTQYERSF
jgi:hypothetical protein